MKATFAASLMTFTLGFALPARADIPGFEMGESRPAELVAASIRLTDGFVVAQIYCGNGTWSQWFPGGRTAKLEVREGAAGPWRLLWAGKLPDINHESYYISRPFATPVRVRTTFRLSISPGDVNPSNDVLMKSFGPVPVRGEQARTIPGGFKDKARSKLVPGKVKLFP